MIATIPRSPDLLRGCRFRLLATREALQSYRFGATIEQITHDVADAIGEQFHNRTIKRDLDLLEALGLAKTIARKRSRRGAVYASLERLTGPDAAEEMAHLAERLAKAEQAAANANLRLTRAMRLVQKLRRRPPVRRTTARRSARPAPVTPSPAVVAAAAKLSPRKQAILKRLAAGRSSAEIAAEFGCAVSSIDTHRSRIRKRLGLKSPDALMRLALLVYGGAV
jgi:DNA-binding CsgD family transcriptional regulator